MMLFLKVAVPTIICALLAGCPLATLMTRGAGASAVRASVVVGPFSTVGRATAGAATSTAVPTVSASEAASFFRAGGIAGSSYQLAAGRQALIVNGQRFSVLAQEKRVSLWKDSGQLIGSTTNDGLRNWHFDANDLRVGYTVFENGGRKAKHFALNPGSNTPKYLGWDEVEAYRVLHYGSDKTLQGITYLPRSVKPGAIPESNLIPAGVIGGAAASQPGQQSAPLIQPASRPSPGDPKGRSEAPRERVSVASTASNESTTYDFAIFLCCESSYGYGSRLVYKLRIYSGQRLSDREYVIKSGQTQVHAFTADRIELIYQRYSWEEEQRYVIEPLGQQQGAKGRETAIYKFEYGNGRYVFSYPLTGQE